MSQTLQSIFLLFFIFFNKEVLCKKHDRAHHTKSDEDIGKIVGGYNTSIQNIPYQAYLILQKGNEYFQCGGSILNARHILTAAHCVRNMQAVYVKIGSTDSNNGGSNYYTTTYVMHPRYNPRTSNYDVAVVKLAQNMKLDGKMATPVKLAPRNMNVPAGTQLLVSGWGATSEGGSSSTTLMAVKVPTVSRADCNKVYSNSITQQMMCAGVAQGGMDSCQGDSGGPAVLDSNKTQVGIVSFGYGCAREGTPGVYANVPNPSIYNFIIANSKI